MRDYLVPPIVRDFADTASAWVASVRNRHVLAQNVSLRGMYAGEEVFILGNGPSLNNFDLKSISGRRVLTMNHFELHPAKNDFDIVAHCIGEPYNSPTWEDPYPMLSGVPAKFFLLDVGAHALLKNEASYNICYYAAGVPFSAPWYRRIDLTKGSLSYQSTSQMAIALAIYMGFRDIKLVGFDHDWLVTRGHSPHFYEEREEVDRADLSAFSYIEMIEISRRLFRIYIKLNQIALKMGSRIFNLSVPTYLDVFPKQ